MDHIASHHIVFVQLVCAHTPKEIEKDLLVACCNISLYCSIRIFAKQIDYTYELPSSIMVTTTTLPKLTAATFGLKLDPKKTTPILVFLGGFPDDHTLWQNQINEFKDTHHIVSIATPHFDEQHNLGTIKSPLPISHEKGYTPNETAQMIADCINQTLPDGRTFDLVTHDWGAYWGYLVVPLLSKRIQRMVVMDIGASVDETQPRGTIWSIPYQLVYAIIFWIGITISPNIAQVFMSIFDLIIGPFSPLFGPLGWKFRYLTDAPRQKSEVKWWMTWPYYQIWFQHILVGKMPPEPKFPSNIPLLFMYGSQKRCQFHTESFLNKLLDDQTDNNGCKHIALNCHHWMMYEKPDEVNKAMREFLSS